MPRRLFLALLLLVAAPLVLLGWLSASATRENQAAAQASLAKLLSSQLYDADRRLSQQFAEYAAQLETELDAEEPVLETLRRMRREVPFVRQGIFIDAAGRRLYPLPGDSVGIDAAEVAASLPGLIDARPRPAIESSPDRASVKGIPPQPARSGQTPKATKSTFATPTKSPPRGRRSNSAWQQWYMADGAQVVYWSFQEDGSAVGFLLERSRWISDLIALLPDDPLSATSLSATALSGTSPSSREALLSKDSYPIRSSTGGKAQATPIGSVQLVDEAQRVVYRWGDDENFTRPELISTNLSAPLASWKLRLHVDQALLPKANATPLLLSLGGIALVLLAVGFYVLTSVRRQIAEASSRVSFAGQVSHELRTPLTNIRLYTELAESDLEKIGDVDSARSVGKRLEVIDHESRRLQRLVSGVLEIIRPSGKPAGVRRTSVNLCEIVAGIAEQFGPSFEAANIQLHTDCDLDQPLSIDPDIVEIVLVNLLSNVEKYVPSGGNCWIKCDRLQKRGTPGESLRIIVGDDGPGISAMHRKKVFRAFARVDDSISAPSGTGIGLTIARRAARRHGGDLVLPGKSEFGGAAFTLSLPLESPADGDA